MGFYKYCILCVLYVNIFIIVAVKSRISDKRRCVDASCSVLISTATAQINYNSDDPLILSFPAGAKLEVYSYGAGERSDLWGIKYKGIRGYGPKSMLRENKKYVSSKDVNVIVATEVYNESILDSKVNIEQNIIASSGIGMKGIFGGIIGASAAEPDIKPDTVRVIAGTTIYNIDSNSDDEHVGEYVTPGTTVNGGLPSSLSEQVPETTTMPSVEASKTEQTAGNAHSDSDKESCNDSVQIVENRTDSDTSGENISANEEGDYSDYEEEGEVEDKPEDVNVAETTEEPRRQPAAESVSTVDVNIVDVTEKIIEQQQSMQGYESVHPIESSVKNEESPSQVQTESVTESVKSEQPEFTENVKSEQPEFTENVKSEQTEFISVTNEQIVNTTVGEGKQPSADKPSSQSPETVQQSDVQLHSPLTVDSDMDSNKVSSVDSISEQPQSVVTQKEMDDMKKEEEKKIEDTKSDQISADITNADEIVQEDVTKTEEKQKTHETSSVEHTTSSTPEEKSPQSKQSIPAVGDESNTVEDNAAGSSVLQQFVSNKDHSDTAKADTVDLPQTLSSESNETENVSGSESDTSLPVESSVGIQSVGGDGEHTSGALNTDQQEEVKLTENVVVNDEVEKLYNSHDVFGGDSVPLPTFPEVVPGSISNEEPSVNEEANSETVSENYVSSAMMWISSSIKYLQSYFESSTGYSDIPNTAGEEPSNTVSSVPEGIMESRDSWDQSKPDSLKEKSCLIQNLGEEVSCEKVTKLPPPSVWAQSESTSTGYEVFGTVIDFEKLPFETILWLLITAGTILTFTLGHYYIEAHRRDGLLVARINKLERELLVLRKESSLLEDRLLKAQDEIQAVDLSSSEAEALIIALKMDLEENKTIRMDLEDQVTSLERELESVMESGMEMHRLLSESLSNQDGSQVLLKTVENLREKLNTQVAEISLLNQNISEKSEEIESLTNDLTHSQEMYKHLEEKLKVLQMEKEEEALELKDKHRALSAQLEEVTESKALDEMRMSTEISKLKLDIEDVQRNFVEKEAELETMREAVKELQSAEKKIDVEALYDAVSISAKLKTTLKEKDEFREKFLEEEGARKLLEDHVRVISREVASLKENFEAAEKEKIDALTKLQVLSNYFKEKESQLQKELGLQESMWLHKQSDDHTIYEQMKSLREENEKYKLQNESLKKEICEQESSFKIQIANIEQRAHENWVSHRQSERRLKEVQQEASQLRNRLTLSEKNAANHTLDDSKPKISESNGDPSSPPPSLIFSATTSPPFMMYPGLPGEFIPPPPLVSAPFSPDSRPPPLGRISSPQLDPRFSPPPPLPYSPYDFPYGGHHSPSPPLTLPQHRTVHKPQPRENAREQKDSSTNYNTSEAADKPSRSRNKR